VDHSSLHERLVHLLDRSLEGRATITEIFVLGAEQVALQLGHGSAGAGFEADGRPAGSTTGPPRSRTLHLLLVSPFPLFWLADRERALASSRSGFADWMRRHLAGALIERVSAGRSGRILRLDCRAMSVPAADGPRTGEKDARGRGANTPAEDEPAGGDATPAALVLDPLPNACRLLVLDAEERVIQRYPPTLHGNPVGRGAPGEIYREPDPRPVEMWAREHGALSASSAGAGDLWVCATPRPSADGPRVIVFLSPRACPPAPGMPFTAGPHSAWNAAETAGAAWIALARHETHLRAVRRILSRERRHLEGLENKLTAETRAAEQGTLLRRQAEALLANPGRVRKGAAQVSLDDPASPGTKIAIDLDPRLNFTRNAALLFRRAARLERGLPQRRRRTDQVHELRGAIDAWTNAPAFTDPWHPLRGVAAGSLASRSGRRDGNEAGAATSELLKQARQMLAGLDPGLRQRWQRMIEEWGAAAREAAAPGEPIGYEAKKAAEGNAGQREPDAATIRPRRFELPGGWIVLVGRSNRENDILTHRLARAEDLWFHARGVAGSHVVLRRGAHAGNPPKEIIRRVAAIAAYFSKGRTSAMVPVVYAEKRHVRKPRKAAPGLALCTRETVIVVEPGLP